MNQNGHIAGREASRWFARQRERGVRESDAQEFETWKRDPDNAAAFEHTQRVWEGLEQLRDSPGIKSILAEPDESRWTSARFVKPVLLAAGLGAVALVSFTLWRTTADIQTYTTAVGEQRTELLPDGTQMVLNTRTSVEVAYSGTRREIRLATGEAIFQVAPRADRPFIVSAGQGAVTALDTRFQVRYENRSVAVTLLEGSVRVEQDSKRGSRVLVPGQQAVYSETQKGITTRNVDLSAEESWLYGRLDFQFTPLSLVVAEANRYLKVPLRIGHAPLARIPVSGTFRTGDVAGLVQGLEAAYSLQAVYESDSISLIPK